MIGPSKEDVERKEAELALEFVAALDRGDIEDAIAAAPKSIFGDFKVAIGTRDKLEIGEQVLRMLTNYILPRAISKAKEWADEKQDLADHYARNR